MRLAMPSFLLGTIFQPCHGLRPGSPESPASLSSLAPVLQLTHLEHDQLPANRTCRARTRPAEHAHLMSSSTQNPCIGCRLHTGFGTKTEQCLRSTCNLPRKSERQFLLVCRLSGCCIQ